MFEIGKKYTYTRYGSVVIWECINKIKDTFVMANTKNANNEVIVWYFKEIHIEKLYWDEYKEPQKLKFYIPIYKVDGKIERGGYTYSSRVKFEDKKPIDWVEVEYTEKI